MSSTTSSQVRPAPQRPPPTSLEEIFRLWGLDPALRRYVCRNLGIDDLYPWQARCLALPGVAEGTQDLLYSAPTSGGKTMVAELLLLLRVVGLPQQQRCSMETETGQERGGGAESGVVAALQQRGSTDPAMRRAVVVLPFISMVTEKTKHLQRIVAPYNRGRPKRQRIKVKALYGGNGGGGLKGAQIAVCTIEKANALINRMAAAEELHELVCLVLDELHMIGEGRRGQTLELLLAKVLCANTRRAANDEPGRQATKRCGQVSDQDEHAVPRHRPPPPPPLEASENQGSARIAGDGRREPALTRQRRTQIIGMSATLSNGAELAGWLGATLHISDFRPIPLDERILLGMHIYDKAGDVVRKFAKPSHPEIDPDHVVTLSRESCREGDQVIIFCPTKQFCHNCALKVARNLKMPASASVASKRSALMSQLAKEMSMGVDPTLQETIPHGVAFHHAGLADTERSAIEEAFRNGTLAVLAATSTLGAGVNLPAGRVILRNLNAAGGGLSATSYRQMAGRAGRKGAGRARGEALIVAANKGQATRASGLMNAGLAAVKSALKPADDGGAGLTRMILECICGKLIKTISDLPEFLSCLLIFYQQPDKAGREVIHDYAWASIQLLIDEGCVELVAPPTTREREAKVARGNRRVAAHPPPPAKRPKPQQGTPLGVDFPSVGRVSTHTESDHGAGEAERWLVPTKLGLAIFRSSMSPGDGLVVYRDLSEAKNGINLRNPLYLAYLLTPLCPPPGLKPNWERLCAMHSKARAAAEEMPAGPGADLVEDFRKIGITENHLHLWASRGPSGKVKDEPLVSPAAVCEAALKRRGRGEALTGDTAPRRREEKSSAGGAARKAVRLVAAMALKDVSDGCNLGQVAKVYGMNKGELQSLRQSTATFSGMVASFLKELGWGMFLMLVKGYIPKLSLGVSKHLLPLMQVPGISRTEASALYQGGFLNAKNLVSAPPDKLATALRINVPFRIRREVEKKGRGTRESIRFERRAQMLRDAARMVHAKREKGNKAQALKLLKAVQGRLGGGSEVGGALLDIGGENDLVRVAPKALNRKRPGERGGPHAATRHGGGRNLGKTGLSDGSGGDSDASSGGSSSSDSGSEAEGDELDRVMAAFSSGRVQEDSDSDENDDVEPEKGRKKSGGQGSADGECDSLNQSRSIGTTCASGLHSATPSRLAGRGPSFVPLRKVPVPEPRTSTGDPPSPHNLPVVGIRYSTSGKTQKSRLGGKRQLATLRDGGTVETSNLAEETLVARAKGSGLNGALGNDGGMVEHPSIAKSEKVFKGAASGGGDAFFIGGGGGSDSATASVSGGSKRKISEASPAARAAKILMTPSNAPACGGTRIAFGSAGGRTKAPANIADDRTMRTPVRTPPESGASSFLYEANNTLPALLGSADDSDDDPSSKAVGTSPTSPPAVAATVGEHSLVGPAFSACRTPAADLGGDSATRGVGVCPADGAMRDVFCGGPSVMAKFSSAWRRSRCFSFVLGSRSLQWVEDGRTGRGGRCLYRRSWETLTSRLAVAPYTVPSAGESFIPLSRRESEDVMRVVSGIAVSFDGKTAQYLALPPLLPRRPTEWHQVPPCSSDQASDGCIANIDGGGGNLPTGRSPAVAAGLVSSARCAGSATNEAALKRPAKGQKGDDSRATALGVTSGRSGGRVATCWEALPKRAVEAIALFVGFPWLCADCSSEGQRRRCHRHRESDGSGGGGRQQRRLKPWNQALLVCRRWNAFGVDALCWLTATEPSGRWGLLRDVMENQKTTKVCLDMKGALVCLRSLGLNVRGPLEDPAVARWLAEPPVEDIAPPQQRRPSKKRKTPAPPPPRASPASLSLERLPQDFVDLWCMQATATLSFMGDMEQALKDLSLALPFHLIEMPAVAAAACMEYCGLELKAGSIFDAHRDLDLRLHDLESVAGQLAGDHDEAADDKTALASPKRIHDILYSTLGVTPPPSWNSSGGSGGRGASKRASLGPTDTTSLQELLKGSGAAALKEDARGFIGAVIQHRALAPAKRSLGGLLAAKRWHAHLGGARVNACIDLLTTTGRMVTSNPPLQNLDHKIRLTRSWRLSLAEEIEAEVPDIEMVPRVWADESPRQAGGVSSGGAMSAGGGLPLSQEIDAEVRESLRVVVAKSDDHTTMSAGEIVGIVEDRCVEDPIYKLPTTGRADAAAVAPCGADLGRNGPLTAESMASLWRERGHPYAPCEAKRTRQVLVRLGFSRGGSGKVYSYPADKVFRVRASFLSDAKAKFLLERGSGGRSPWFGNEAILRPRDALVAPPGYVFVSADYSQVEMRLMAHLSGDPDLQRVFADGGDVFRKIAAALRGGGKKAADITVEERSQTKIVVYGVLYGQSADALAPQLGMSRPKAWKTRQTVLKTYPRLTEFLEKVKADCKTCGYVETLLGRRRYLPQINSEDAKERSRAERQAANTVCQGSAADLLKLAATNVAARLDRCGWMSTPGTSCLTVPYVASAAGSPMTPCRFPDDNGRSELARRPACRLVLSIHDELVYEVIQARAEEVVSIVRSCMEGACSLSVPLVAHPQLGKKWGSMTPVKDSTHPALPPSRAGL